MNRPEFVVFDCNVFVQSLISPSGPAGQCFKMVEDGPLRVFVSQPILEEVRDVALRPKLVKRFQITPDRVQEFLARILVVSEFVEHVADVFEYDRDPDDAHYVNLAAAAKASLIVSRDKDLLDLRDPSSADGHRFRQLCPEVEILTPVGLIRRIEEAEDQPSE